MTRLRHVAQINPVTPEFDRLDPDAEVTFLPLEAVWPGPRLDLSRLRTKSSVETGYTRFREGEILVPKITPTFQADRTVIVRGLIGGVGAGTTELHVVRPDRQIDPRYVRYLLSCKFFLDAGEAAMTGVAGQQRVPDTHLRDLTVPIVDLHRQHFIADYLDAETARIDALIEKKRRLTELILERREAVVERRIRSLASTYGSEPLKHAARGIEVGIVITPAAWYADSGVLALRGVNVQPGALLLDDVVYLTEAGHRQHQNSVLHAGDVVVVRTGQAGAAVVIPNDLDGINCIDLVIVRPSNRLIPKFVEMVSTQIGRRSTSRLIRLAPFRLTSMWAR